MESTIIPVGVIAESGKEITFSADVLNIPSGLHVYLEDKNNGSFKRLDEPNSEYKITLDSDLNGIGRFFIHTTSQALSNPDVNLSNVSIYKTDNTNLRVVGVQNGNVTLDVFNILGKKVMTTNFNASGVNDVKLPSFSTGIYIVKLKAENGTMSKKIVLQ